ncbi:MAG: S8 family serine peptidase [Methyloligellaceae bacterium]
MAVKKKTSSKKKVSVTRKKSTRVSTESTKSKKKTISRRKTSAKKSRSDADSGILQIAITFNPPSELPGPTKYPGRMNRAIVQQLVPDVTERAMALAKLQELGFVVSGTGSITASVRGTRALFEKTFGTQLTQFSVQTTSGHYACEKFYYPGEDAPWDPDPNVSHMIDDAYIQWPHIYMNQLFPPGEPSPLPPQVDYHHLRVPGDVVNLVNAAPIHRNGGTGKGVTVAMIDSGFALDHQYFKRMAYNTTVVLAPGASDRNRDGNGHGTAECANLLAIAPGVNFIGVKLDNENDPRLGATILEGLQEALSHNPDIISVSLGFDLVLDGSANRSHLNFLPNSLVALEAEIEAAVANGTVIVFSAGNGHVAFPGMMPDVISAGGTYVDELGAIQASDYASGFISQIYPGRQVPDLSGLVGMADNGAAYIMLPLQSGCAIDRTNNDGTGTEDGWAVISGTSAAAPQLAGVCALLKERNPSLSPDDIKSLLRRSTIDVVNGRANAASNQGVAQYAGVGPDSATGAGLVDAFAAWSQV